jgi:hypothetical protein
MTKRTVFVAVFVAIIMVTGVSVHGETMEQIDHKDEPGEYRAAVFAAVQKTLGFKGEPPTGPTVFVGDWICRIGNPYSIATEPPMSYQTFRPDGSSSARAMDGSWENTKDRWKLNGDLSLSLWSYVEAMPEYGIDEPTYSEERYHVLVKTQNEFVLFNGDGSLILVYSRNEKK